MNNTTQDPRECKASKCKFYHCFDCLHPFKDTYECVILFGNECPDFTPKTESNESRRCKTYDGGQK